MAVVLGGCGPWRAGTRLAEAAASVSAAEIAQAPTLAPYEYTAASAYLLKAREDHAYAKFETAEVYATKARDCARHARKLAESQSDGADDLRHGVYLGSSCGGSAAVESPFEIPDSKFGMGAIVAPSTATLPDDPGDSTNGAKE